MVKRITLAQLRTMAKQAGLKLSDEELEQLVPGVNRSRKQLSELRELVTDNLEPAGTFVVAKTAKGR
jgi:Asp-tRNA(Asn)/Glu-tRNA(Gln) amidotransferase C subunit